MSVQPTDIAIFIVSFAACGYCIVLSRRLRALQNTKNGLGATIMAMSQSISAMSTTTKDTRTSAEETASRLVQLMDESSQMCTRLETLNQTTKSEHSDATQKIDKAQVELAAMMRDMLDQSKSRILDMSNLIQKMHEMTETDVTNPHSLFDQIDIPNPLDRAKSEYRYET